jgi:hypothetical protein
MESLTLTVPQSVTSYRVLKLVLDWSEARIKVELADQAGVVIRAEYGGAEATALMVSLNKANLSTNSLHKRILQQLATDGKLPAGTVTGAPD